MPAVSDTFEPGPQSDDCHVICPHCGHSYQAEPCAGDADETPSVQHCDKCLRTFQLWASISITYHTSPNLG
jgi:hypothetical protein